MPNFQCAPRYLLLALAGCALLLGVPTAARGETYGELGHFGRAGIGHGEFKITPGTHAFGVDPTDDSVYVGDEIKRGEYRIQKFTASGTFLAETVPFKVANHDGIEGIAVDPVEKRVYVLALEKREATLMVDASEPAAGTLYAFSTEPSGETLVPSAGTSEGVLAGPSTLEPQSDAPERAMLEPKGIAVDPTTHDVIILGEVDVGEEKNEPQLHVALQRVHSSGTRGERYIDSTGFFGPQATPNSPVVLPSGAVYVALEQAQEDTLTGAQSNELVQIPSAFASTTPPTPFVQLTLRGTFEEEHHSVVEFDDNEPSEYGGGLSFAPENPKGLGEGTIYARAHVFVGANETGSYYPGMLAFDGEDGSEVGWTGGQTKQSGDEAPCAISFGGETYPSVAAGSEHKVFMLDPGKPTANPPRPPRVVEFGPEGEGCPVATASVPEATIDGQSLSPSEPVSAETEVKFSSAMIQANALSVEWNFGDGQTETVSEDEYQHTEVSHKFARGGELTVTETIHTDDLATPTIVEQTKISVSVTAPPPTAVLEGPPEVTLGGGATLSRLEYLEGGGLGLEEAAQSEEAKFDASASFASTGPNRIDEYHWAFGDGKSETTATATTKHKYNEAGVYRAELTVTDAHGLTSKPSTLTVKVNDPVPATSVNVGGPVDTPGAPVVGTPAAATTGAHAPGPASSASSPTAPDARLASTSFVLSSTGIVTLEVTCPIGASSCTGTVTLRTLGTVSVTSSSRTKKLKTGMLTLASGTFKVASGHEESVKLHLSVKARLLLAHAHVLRVRATIATHDPTGVTHTSQTAVTLHAPTKAHHDGKG